MAHFGDSSAIVCDIGSGTTKIGFAGRDTPTYWAPTLVGSVPGAAAPPPGTDAGAAAWTPAPRRGNQASTTRASAGVAPLECAGQRHKRYHFDFFGTDAAARGLRVRSPLVDGLVEDWDAVEGVMDHAIEDRLALKDSLRGHPVLMAEHINASKVDRERWCQILFEKHGAPGVFMARSGVLAVYANARMNGLAVDMGAGGTQITPVEDGYALMMGARIHGIGGRALDGLLAEAVYANSGVSLESAASSRSSFGGAVAAGNLPSAAAVPGSLSIQQWRGLDFLRETKEAVCRVSDTSLSSALGGSGSGGGSGAAMSMTSLPYELPDGNTVIIGAERVTVPELVFTGQSPVASAIYSGAAAGAPPSSSSSAPSVLSGAGFRLLESKGLPDAIAASIISCDHHVRRELASNLVLTGGASAMPGMPERLTREVAALTASIGSRPKWTAASSEERALGAWLGGSILGSLDTFSDLWFSAEEYAEHGAKYIHRKCP